MDKNISYRKAKNHVFKGLVIFLSGIIVLPLFPILYYVFKQGISSINWTFLTNIPKPVGEAGGGIENAIIGSFIIIFFAALMAVPFAILIAVYLNESRDTKLSYWTRISMDVLQGIPSIVLGIIAYLWIVKPAGDFSAISGSFALALIMLPTVVKSVEETLKLIPHTLKEASLSLGVTYNKTIRKIIIPSAMSGIISGTMLGISRVAGETAPLLFTAFGNPFMSTKLNKPMMSIPLIIFNYATSPYDDWHNLAWGASFVLIAFLLILNITSKIIEKRWKVEF